MDKMKLNELKNYIGKLGKVVIAFSGGVDSTFLLKVCKDVLIENVVAITIASPYIPKWEIEEAKNITKSLQVKHIILEVPILDEIQFNPKDKCYKCKKFVFSKIIEEAKKLGISNILDGTNFDDTKDYRPGMKALKELSIKSPLLKCEFSKVDIRSFSKDLKLPTWNKPAYACLLTRLQPNSKVEEEILNRIENSEVYLRSIGFNGSRVRTHGDLARIEIHPKDFNKISDADCFKQISFKLKSLGFKYVTLDLDGYKMGSLN